MACTFADGQNVEEEKTRSGLTKQKKAASESENPDTEAAFQRSFFSTPNIKTPSKRLIIHKNHPQNPLKFA